MTRWIDSIQNWLSIETKPNQLIVMNQGSNLTLYLFKLVCGSYSLFVLLNEW